MHSYIRNAKTTHFRCGGNGWFRACWVAPKPLGNTESFCGYAPIAALKNMTEAAVSYSLCCI